MNNNNSTISLRKRSNSLRSSSRLNTAVQSVEKDGNNNITNLNNGQHSQRIHLTEEQMKKEDLVSTNNNKKHMLSQNIREKEIQLCDRNIISFIDSITKTLILIDLGQFVDYAERDIDIEDNEDQ